MRTWPAPGSGISRSTIWNGPLALTIWATRILGIDPPMNLRQGPVMKPATPMTVDGPRSPAKPWFAGFFYPPFGVEDGRARPLYSARSASVGLILAAYRAGM